MWTWKSPEKKVKAPPASTITKAVFGTVDGAQVDIYTLRNAKGAEARIMTYGGIVTSLKMPDKAGNLGDVVLGYDHFESYLKNSQYLGALIGRYGNRIAGGKFTLEGKTYTLAKNNGPNCLHGGVKGFDKVIWSARPADGKLGPALGLTYISKDGEEGFPGTLTVMAIYTLTEDNALRLDFTAMTDKPTICNLTHHSYFNLAGKGDILGHQVMIEAKKFTPVDQSLIPTGELKPVKDTPFDFTAPASIGARIDSNDEQLKFGHGYDHNFALDKYPDQLGLAARVHEPESGRLMEVWTTEPGLQFYSGNFIGNLNGKGGAVYRNRDGFCMEPQHYPDSPNRPDFPSTELKPRHPLHSTIIYKFSVK
jgi:aldose 1-epimerase